MIESFAYLGALVFSIFCLGTIDKRYKLALFGDRHSSIVAIAVGMLVFIAWDIVGIAAEIFFIGHTHYLSGITVLPEMPLEELFFLFLLCYVTLLTWLGSKQLWPDM